MRNPFGTRTFYLYVAEKDGDIERLVGVVKSRSSVGSQIEELVRRWPSAYSHAVELHRRPELVKPPEVWRDYPQGCDG